MKALLQYKNNTGENEFRYRFLACMDQETVKFLYKSPCFSNFIYYRNL